MSSNSTSTLSAGEINTLQAIRVTLSSLTFIVAVLASGYIILFRKFRFPSTRLVLYLTLTIALDSVAYFLPEGDLDNSKEASGICVFQGFFISFAEWATALWIFCIAFNIYAQVCRQQVDSVAGYEKFYHALVWGVSLFFSILPFFNPDVYGPAGAWCWIKKAYPWWRLLTWYLPLWLIFIAVALMYGRVVKRLLDEKRDIMYGSETKIEQRERWQTAFGLSRYPLIFLLVWIFPFINRIENWASDSDGVMWLNTFHVISQGIQGLLNALVYFWDEDWRTQCTPAAMKTAAVTFFSKREREASKPQRYELGDVSEHTASMEKASDDKDVSDVSLYASSSQSDSSEPS